MDRVLCFDLNNEHTVYAFSRSSLGGRATNPLYWLTYSTKLDSILASSGTGTRQKAPSHLEMCAESQTKGLPVIAWLALKGAGHIKCYGSCSDIEGNRYTNTAAAMPPIINHPAEVLTLLQLKNLSD